MDVPETLPAEGVPAEAVLAELARMREADLPTHGGRLFAYVYDPAVPGLDELAASAHALSAHVNGLDPTAFPSLLAMENGIVGAAARLLGGGPDGVPTVVGSVTSGGTESLLLAVKAARDARPDVAEPRLVVPASGHAAFAKAAAYLRVALDVVAVGPDTLRPDPAAMAAAIGPDTVLVACSAPSYPYGVVDPVADVAEVAARAGVRCHVDACFGGWLLPYLRRAGRPVPPFGFELPGVTSVSVDLHKYAYTPKGVSVLLHRDAALRRSQYFGYADWPGYPMLNATVASTRSGGPIAAAWATLRFLGDAGYLRLAERTWAATTGIADAVSGTGGLRLLVAPESSVVAFTSTAVDLFVLADELAARGWHTQPQLPYGGLPASIHLTVTASVADRVDEFAAALRVAVDATREAGPVRVPAELAAAVGDLTADRLSPDLVAQLAAAVGFGAGSGGSGPDGAGSGSGSGSDGAGPDGAGADGAGSDGAGRDGRGGGVLPDRMATVNTLLVAVSPEVRAALLIEFVSMLQRP
ncbi:MAG: aminotransferase class V-fold PLP-dependent enzyme [Actinocatenispora sp.]